MVVSSPKNLLTEDVVAEDMAAHTMVGMGFNVADVTNALEQTSFVFGKALLLLLNGLDAQRTKYDTQERFRRHHNKHVKGIEATQLARGEVVAQYMKRAQEAYDFAVTVWDLGQCAGRTSGA